MSKNARNSSIALQKTLSMFMVVALHILGNGGVLTALLDAPVRYGAVLLSALLIFVLCIVIDSVRYWLFKKMKVNERVDRAVQKLKLIGIGETK